MLLPAGIIRSAKNEATMPFGQVYKGPRKVLASATNAFNRNDAARETRTHTFPVGTTEWTAPPTTALIRSGVGRGNPGTPYRPSDPGGEPYYQTKTETTTWGPGGSNRRTTTSWNYFTWGNAPFDSCAYADASDGSGNSVCVYYYQHYTEPSPSEPATTGPSTQAFGQSWPGGYAGATPPLTTIENIAVIPGQQYSVYVPSGGTLTIEYYT